MSGSSGAVAMTMISKIALAARYIVMISPIVVLSFRYGWHLHRLFFRERLTMRRNTDSWMPWVGFPFFHSFHFQIDKWVCGAIFRRSRTTLFLICLMRNIIFIIYIIVRTFAPWGVCFRVFRV